jgi:hypothetical protein
MKNKQKSKEMLALEIEKAEKCLENCPLAKIIATNSDELLGLMMEQNLNDTNDINFIRGALRQLEKITIIPKEIMFMKEVVEQRKLMKEKQLKEMQEKRKEMER